SSSIIPVAMASCTRLFARPVFTPARWPPGVVTTSSVWAYLRFGLSEVEYQQGVEGRTQLRMEPVLGQCKVMTWPSARRTSTIDRVERVSSSAACQGGNAGWVDDDITHVFSGNYQVGQHTPAFPFFRIANFPLLALRPR